MRITRVYTRSGDTGETSLATGERVAKDDARVEAYGAVEELAAVLALARVAAADLPPEAAQEVEETLQRIQMDLFGVGAEVASPDPGTLTIPRIGSAHVDRLEREIDRFNADLAPLEEFLLPGGGACGARIHHARVVCRRTERRGVTLVRAGELEEPVMRYLNRLGDLLFVLSRWAATAAGEPETLWDRGAP